MAKRNKSSHFLMVEGLFEGTVTHWNNERAYGFIRTENLYGDVLPSEHGPLIFLHMSEINGKQEPQVGAKVRFRIIKDKSRFRATRVSML
jgi:cold shock CspA family protein